MLGFAPTARTYSEKPVRKSGLSSPLCLPSAFSANGKPPDNDTEIETAFEDSQLQLGHLVTLGPEILNQISCEQVNPSIFEDLNFQFLQHDTTVIEHLHQAEASIREVQILVDEWTAVARTRLQ